MRLRFESCAVVSIARFISRSWPSFAEGVDGFEATLGGSALGASSCGGYPGFVAGRCAVRATDAWAGCVRTEPLGTSALLLPA